MPARDRRLLRRQDEAEEDFSAAGDCSNSNCSSQMGFNPGSGAEAVPRQPVIMWGWVQNLTLTFQESVHVILLSSALGVRKLDSRIQRNLSYFNNSQSGLEQVGGWGPEPSTDATIETRAVSRLANWGQSMGLSKVSNRGSVHRKVDGYQNMVKNTTSFQILDLRWLADGGQSMLCCCSTS